MFIGAGVPERAVPFTERLAVGTGWIEPKAILPLEEIGKSEVVLRLWLCRLGIVGNGVGNQR